MYEIFLGYHQGCRTKVTVPHLEKSSSAVLLKSLSLPIYWDYNGPSIITYLDNNNIPRTLNGQIFWSSFNKNGYFIVPNRGIHPLEIFKIGCGHNWIELNSVDKTCIGWHKEKCIKCGMLREYDSGY